MNNVKTRNTLLDFVKTIAAFCVIFVHFQFPGYFGSIMCCIGVIGVIIFFLISGYASYSTDGSSAPKLLKRFKRNLLLLIIALFIYLVFEIVIQLTIGDITKWVNIFSNPKFYFDFFILGDFTFIHADPLWFMLALIYCYLILYFLEKYRLHKKFYIALPILLLLRIGMETFTNSYSSDNPWISWHLSGNFLVGGLPIMLLGNFIAYKKDKLAQVNTKTLIILFIVFLLTSLITACFKINNTIDITQPFKIGTALFAFLLCIKHPKIHISNFIEYIGAFLSTYIYLFHNLIGKAIELPLNHFGINHIALSWTLPIIVLVLSTLIAYLIHKTASNFKSHSSCQTAN